MNSKAQIASLDFILSVILVVVALGLIMQTIEVNQYTMKEMEINNELERIGETAANILISHPEFTCDLYDELNDSIGELQNCIVKRVNIDKTRLGIPSDYECDIDITTGTLINNPCNGNSNSADAGYYSASRIVAFFIPASEEGIKKTKLYDCMNEDSGCQLKNSVLTVKVWRVS